MKIKVNKEDLKEILQDVNDRAKTCKAYQRLDAAVRSTKVHLECRRWFSKSYGNTYHSVRIYLDDQQVVYIPFVYGYGEQCLQTAVDWLYDNNHIEGKKEYGTLYLTETLGATWSIEDVAKKSLL